MKSMMFGVVVGAISMGLLVVWANETNVGLQLKALNCTPTTSLGVDSYLCFVEG